MILNNCKLCNVVDEIDELPEIFSSEDIYSYILRVYGGIVTKKALDISVYDKISEQLMNAVFKGFGKDIMETSFGTPDYEMLKALETNIYKFSAARNYTQTREISKYMIRDGKLRSFKDFKEKAESIFGTFNDRKASYLKTEYVTAISSARSASQWIEIDSQKSLYPNLEYKTQGDSRVRPPHVLLNGIIRPVNDSFWKVYYPPNGWRCRCTVLQRDEEYKITDLSNKPAPTEEEVPKIFRMNSGIDKKIYSEKHPYFSMVDKQFKDNNYGLPLPKRK